MKFYCAIAIVNMVHHNLNRGLYCTVYLIVKGGKYRREPPWGNRRISINYDQGNDDFSLYSWRSSAVPARWQITALRAKT